MKKIYFRPTLKVECFATEEIMDQTNPLNALSYDQTLGTPGGTYDDPTLGYIQFQTGDGNVLNSIDYNDFTN